MRMMMILVLSLCFVFKNEIQAKPKAHVEFDVTVGRPKKKCEKVWLCIENYDVKITVLEGMIKVSHGIVIDEDGSISIAVNEELIKRQDLVKYNSLLTGTMTLDGEETLPQLALNKLGYTGKNYFPAGKYKVTRYMGYFLIKLSN